MWVYNALNVATIAGIIVTFMYINMNRHRQAVVEWTSSHGVTFNQKNNKSYLSEFTIEYRFILSMSPLSKFYSPLSDVGTFAVTSTVYFSKLQMSAPGFASVCKLNLFMA